MSWPSGDRIQTSDEPPSRKSILATGELKPLGPHQRITLSPSLHAFQTRSTGASKVRVTMRSLTLVSCGCACAPNEMRPTTKLETNNRNRMSAFLALLFLLQFAFDD